MASIMHGIGLDQQRLRTELLDRLGYPALKDESGWRYKMGEVTLGRRIQWPKLDVRVTGHEEMDGHTYYKVECSINPVGSAPVEWTVHKRLKEFREDWYDQLTDNCGWDEYYTHVAVPFAQRGGMPGTTRVLSEWADAIARATNQGQCPPAAVAVTLSFLDINKKPAIAVEPFLLTYSYPCPNEDQWFKSPPGVQYEWPTLSLKVSDSADQSGQTLYVFNGTLKFIGGVPLNWQVRKPMDTIENHMYNPMIAAWEAGRNLCAPFPAVFLFHAAAQTVEGLNAWVRSLAKCINERIAPPCVVALVFRYLEIPPPMPSPPRILGA